MTIEERALAAMDREIARIFAGERRIGKISTLITACLVEAMIGELFPADA